jgi:DICT domain-containing protein
MSKADEYRLKAEQADHEAEIASTAEAKQFYRQVAQQWRELAGGCPTEQVVKPPAN